MVLSNLTRNVKCIFSQIDYFIYIYIPLNRWIESSNSVTVDKSTIDFFLDEDSGVRICFTEPKLNNKAPIIVQHQRRSTCTPLKIIKVNATECIYGV
jgi:hypothetical protein